VIESQTFIPFFGFVENIIDPLKDGRIQVRVIGYNTQNKGILPTENLKWFSALGGQGASLGGVGDSPTGYLVNSLVFGFYLSADRQEGIILGSVVGQGDVSSLATGGGGSVVENKRAGVVKGVPDSRGDSWDQPEVPYATTYPASRVLTTTSGHAIEYDDTPGAERISIYHKSGTYEEIHPDGARVVRNVKDSYEIDVENKKLLINGDWDVFVNGDYRLNVGGEFYCKVGGGVTFDTKLVRTLGNSEATDHISSNISGAFHVHSGVQSGNANTLTPVGVTTGFAPTPANTFSLTTEDSGFTPEVVETGLKEGFITPEDVEVQQTYEPVVEAVDETPKPEVKAEVVDCGAAIGADGKVDYSVLLAPGISLRSISLGAVVSQYAIKDQNGLSKSEIICNLKNIAENVLVPLFRQYPGAMVTSGFRAGTGKSQHMKGEAVDIQFRGFSKAQYYQVALWVKANLPYDQLILEYKNFGTGLPWIHISLKRGKAQRYQIMTFFNHRKAADGLRNMS
jgi:hypothetical protein